MEMKSSKLAFRAKKTSRSHDYKWLKNVTLKEKYSSMNILNYTLQTDKKRAFRKGNMNHNCYGTIRSDQNQANLAESCGTKNAK